jgi:hypothetical protein
MSGDRITSIVENGHGDNIGTIVIKADGSFQGRFFRTTAIADVLGATAKAGFSNGIILKPKMIPARPSQIMCHMGSGRRINDDHKVPAIVKVGTHGDRHSTYLCKPCLDHWLDYADDDDSLEPASLRFLDVREG